MEIRSFVIVGILRGAISAARTRGASLGRAAPPRQSNYDTDTRSLAPAIKTDLSIHIASLHRHSN